MLKTLKARLYFLAILIIAPCYAFIYLSFDYSRSIVVDELLATAERISFQAAEAQSRQVMMVENYLKSLVLVPQLQHPESRRCQEFVQQISQLDDRYVNVGVPSVNGVLTCNGTPLDAPVDVSDRLYIRDAMDRKRFTSSGVHHDRVMRKLTINFAYPVRRDSSEEIIAAAVVVVSLDWWEVLLKSLQLPVESVAYVLDSYGRIVANYPQDANLNIPTRFNTIWHSDDGVRRIYTKHDVFDSHNKRQLTFVTGIAIDSSLSAINDRYRIIFAVFTVTVIMVLILFRSFFLNTILMPLNRLADLTFKMGRNEKFIMPTDTGVKEMDFLQASFIDMSERKSQAESQIIKQTLTDGLTGISNRTAFSQELSEHLHYASHDEARLAVILIDLDDFKEVNDTLGHEAGDKVLRLLAKRLVENCPFAKLISRPGGDEFLLLVEHEQMAETELNSLCDSVLSLIKQPISLSHNDVVISASIGVAHYPEDGHDVDSLMSAADQAMYYAKECGRDTVRRFNWELRRSLMEKIEIIKDLRNAIENNEFFLVYQPIVNRLGKVVKFEALIRWNHPVKGLIPPDGFIPFAEQSRQIIEIGRWVIATAQTDWQSLQQVYGENVQVSVNVSPLQLSADDSNNIAKQLMVPVAATSSHESNALVVEITENSLMNLDENTRRALLDFRAHGVQVALDDFGTGYSSLAYIMNYDIDYLKIDKSFVQKLNGQVSADSLCEAIISMSHTLGIAVIAEGVETEQQARLLTQYGCDYMQGYYFAKPMPLPQVLTFQPT